MNSLQKEANPVPARCFSREPEVERLRALGQQATAGSGNVVVITGEEGVGKTSLIKACLEQMQDQDTDCVYESFANGQTFEPYRPFLRVLDQLAKDDGTSPSEVGTMAAKTGDQGQSSNSTTLESLYQLQKQQALAQQKLAGMIMKAASQKTLIIALDDAQFAPLSAWKFMHYLSGYIRGKGILLILGVRHAGRAVRTDAIPHYADIMQRMNREGLYEEMRLQRFDLSGVRRYLNQAFPKSDFSSHFTQAVYASTHGHPALLSKALELLQERELIYQKQNVWYDQGKVLAESLAELMSDEHGLGDASQLVEELSSSHQRLLQYAALLSGPFDQRFFADLMKRSRLQVIKDLLALKEGQVLTGLDEDRYQFKQAAIRRTILDGMSEPTKAEMHEEIAAVIEAGESFDATERVFLLAHHYSHTENTAAAIRYLQQAGLQSLQQFAFLEAREYLQKSLSLMPAEDEANRMDRIEILVQLAWLEHVLGDWSQALDCCERAHDLCTEEDDRRFRIQLWIQQGLTAFRMNDWPKSQSYFEEVLKHKASLGEFEEAMIHYGLGDVYFETGRYEPARSHFEIALEKARKIDNQRLAGSILNNLGILEHVCGQYLRAIALYSASMEIHKSLGDEFGMARLYHNIGMNHAEQRNWQEANQFYGKSLSVSDVMGLRPLKSITFLNRALALANLGNFDEAQEYNFKALELLRALGDRLGMAEHHKVQGVIEREQNNWKPAREQFDHALQMFEAMDNGLGVSETLYELGQLASAMGDPESARQALRGSIAAYRELGLENKVRILEQELGPDPMDQIAVPDQVRPRAR